jgi:hypothetical protein
VTVTQEPRVVRTVDDAELVDLDRQGLIYSSESGEHGRHKWIDDDEPATDETPATTKTDKTKGA